MIKSNRELISPAHHGAFDYAELAQLGLAPDNVLDFSVNSNPYGPPPGVREAIAAVPLERYPDRECLALRHKLAELHGVNIENIVVGNGTAELLQLIAFACLERDDTVVMPEVTFGEYGRVVQLVGANMAYWHPAAGEIQDARLVFLCNPNNPDGTWIPPEKINQLAQKYPRTLFVVDEAYSNFLETPQTIIDSGCPNVLAVRSMTKDYALAGLRLGYVVGQPDLIEVLRRLRPAWNVNALAQAAGLAVINSGDWLNKTITRLHQNKRELVGGLQSLGLKPLPSLVHYFLVDVANAAEFRSKLLRHGVMVRDCASFGLPEFVRIATRTPEDNQHLLAAIKKGLA
jgi:histidinol-phosphate aminotransferase